MPYFRKRPVEAHQYVNDTIEAALLITIPFPELQFISHGGVIYLRHNLEALTRLFPGDWVVRGTDGKFSIMLPTEFAQTYEEMECPTSKSAP